jgi:hypothetical protein
LSHSSKLKIGMHLKFEVKFITNSNVSKTSFSSMKSGLAKRAVNFTDSKMYLLATTVDIFNSLINSFKT